MAKIVGVHGVGHQFKGENMLRDDWLPALKDGLSRAGRILPGDSEFAVAFYGDLFRPSGKSALDPLLTATDVDEDWEQEMLELWWREAANVEPASVTGPGASTKLGVPFVIQRALNAVSHSSFFAALAERALIADLKQVRRYLREAEIRRQAVARVTKMISSDTRIVVAHSLGSLVAYEALCANPHGRVEVLVTLGSPLGIANLIFHQLQPAPIDGRGAWPAGVLHWVNIADRGDIVALVKSLGSHFGPRLVDKLVDNGARAHDVTRYLTTPELGNALALGL